MKKYYKSKNVYKYSKLLDGTTILDIIYECGDAMEITKEEFYYAKKNNILNEYQSLDYGAYTCEQYQAVALDEEDKIVDYECVYVRK